LIVVRNTAVRIDPRILMANNAFYKRMWDEVLHKGFWEGDI
jgi:hypothetical protein